LAIEQQMDSQVAREVSTTTKTVRKWRSRFVQSGIDGLYDLPRSGAPTKFQVGQRCEVIAIACDAPANYGFPTYTLWNLDLLTQVVHNNVEGPTMSRSSVARTLGQNDLRPHKMRMWLHSKDPDFKEKVNDLVCLYTDPPEEAAVICVDEKTGMQALERKYETCLPGPGKPGRYEYEYIRHGTQALITGFNIRTGQVTATCGPTRTADDLISYMETLAARYRPYRKIIIIWDNLNIHHNGPSERWTRFNEKHGNKFEFHYTPIHASWMNQVEIFFSILQKRCLKHGSFTSADDLKQKVLAFIERWNQVEGHPFNWTFRGYPMQNKEKEAA
jgi:transposase